MDCSPPRLPHPWRFFRQEYWNGLLYPPPGDLPNPRIKPRSPSLQADSLLSEPQGKPSNDTVLSVTWYYEKRTGLEIRTKFLSRIKHYVTLNILLKPWTVFSSKKIRRYIGYLWNIFRTYNFLWIRLEVTQKVSSPQEWFQSSIRTCTWAQLNHNSNGYRDAIAEERNIWYSIGFHLLLCWRVPRKLGEVMRATKTKQTSLSCCPR